MLLQPLIPFWAGLYIGLSLALSTDTGEALCAALLLGLLVGAAMQELNTQNRRRQVSIYEMGNLQGQYQAIESVRTSSIDGGSPFIMPEIAYFLEDGALDDVTDNGG